MDFFLNKIDKFWDNLTIFDEKVKDLKRKREELNALKEDTESRRSTGLHPRKQLRKEVELWFSNVERINGELLDLEQKIGESYSVSRGLLTGNVLKKIVDVEELLQQGKFPEGLVVDNPGWIGQVLSTTTLHGEAAEICMKEIWAYLMDDDIHNIGVWGMGGIGKTTIMKLIHNKLLKEAEKFDIVIWITVSKEMNISKIQNCIAQAMGVQVKLYDVEDETIRAGMVYEMLAQKDKFVLILDDLWDRLSLEKVGIPEPSKGSKLLVTTRLQEVCLYLNCREVKVPTLSKPDAWELFLENVGRDVLNHPYLLKTVKSVAEECAGLPLAIVVIASSMRGVRETDEWRNALHELKTHVESVNGIEEKVFRRLQFSYDRLQNEKVQQCFLSCALYPEDWAIKVDDLIQLWIAEGFVEEMDSLEMEIAKGHAILNKLRNCCLVENATKGHAIRNKVKLHDVVRDMALRITSVRPRFFVRAGMQLDEIPNLEHWNDDLEKASLMENWNLQIPYRMATPKCPNLTTLLLSRCYIRSIPEGFFEQMHRLKILDLSGTCLEILPNSIYNLTTLTTLLLHSCSELKKVPSLPKLEALKKLDLSRTNIKDFPDGMEKLVNLKYLDLSQTRIRGMTDGIVTKFTSLQHLKLSTLSGCISVRGATIGAMRKLEIFEGRFDDLNEWNIYAQALLARNSWHRQYRIFVGGAVENISHYKRNKSSYKWDKLIDIDGGGIFSTRGINIPSDVQYLGIQNITVGLCEEEEDALFSWFIIQVPLNGFSSLSKIVIRKCRNITKLFSSSNWVLQNLQNLKYLHIEDCEKMEEIIASESESESGMDVEEGITSTSTTASASASFKFTTTLPKLKTLELWNLTKFKSICGANGVMVCDSIESIHILGCEELKRIPLKLPLKDDGQPSPFPSLRSIYIHPAKCWSQLEWDHPNAKSTLFKFLLNPYS